MRWRAAGGEVLTVCVGVDAGRRASAERIVQDAKAKDDDERSADRDEHIAWARYGPG